MGNQTNITDPTLFTIQLKYIIIVKACNTCAGVRACEYVVALVVCARVCVCDRACVCVRSCVCEAVLILYAILIRPGHIIITTVYYDILAGYPLWGGSSVCLICMKYRRIILIIIIISPGQILLSYIANTSRTHACTHAHARTHTAVAFRFLLFDWSVSPNRDGPFRWRQWPSLLHSNKHMRGRPGFPHVLCVFPV